MEAYVVSLSGSTGKWQVSSGGGREPLWSRDGRELFYRTDDGKMIAVPVETEPAFAIAGKPKVLFSGDFRTGGRWNYDVTRDGKRFLMAEALPDAAPAEFQVWVNFARGTK
jgi:Tol biopolymer transport system component